VARWRAWRRPVTWLVAAALVLSTTAFVVTFALNVPLNDDLATVDRGTADLTAARESYESDWNAWNGVRSLASLAAFSVLTVALLLERRGGGRRTLD
jgi:uncharacterized membrane protein